MQFFLLTIAFVYCLDFHSSVKQDRLYKETQLLGFIDAITNNMNKSDNLTMDIFRAFDKVSHSLLTHTS